MSETPSAEQKPESPNRPTGWLVGFFLALVAIVAMGVVIVQVVDQDEEVVAAPEESPATETGGEEAVAGGDASAGAGVYSGTCQACHGPDGVGIEGLGKALAASSCVQDLSDDELVAMIAAGRDTSDPENSTGVAMPAKGGDPSLSDADLYDVVAYMRTLQ